MAMGGGMELEMVAFGGRGQGRGRWAGPKS